MLLCALHATPAAQGKQAFRSAQQALGRLVRHCCEAVDAAAGTGFLAEEQGIEEGVRAWLRAALKAPLSTCQGALDALGLPAEALPPGPVLLPAVAAARGWAARRDSLAPRLRRAVSKAAEGPRPLAMPRAAPPLVAVQRDWALSAAGCCTNPLCRRVDPLPDRDGPQVPRFVRCAGCKMRYCRCGALVGREGREGFSGRTWRGRCYASIHGASSLRAECLLNPPCRLPAASTARGRTGRGGTGPSAARCAR